MNPRGSLSNIFDDITIPASTHRSRSTSPVRGGVEALRATIRKGWPSAKRGTEQALSFTITSDHIYRTYQEGTNPSELFNKASTWLTTIKQYEVTGEKEDIIHKELIEQLSHAIFGSNQIELAGLHLDETINLCRKIFLGEPVSDDIDETSEEYQSLLQSFVLKKKQNITGKHVLCSRREVVQHAKAFQYLIDAIVNFNQTFTEGLLKETHRILCKNVDIEHYDGSATESQSYAGVYRSIPVAAGNTMFTNPQHIQKEMIKLVEDFNTTVANAEETGTLDPFSLSAEYCLRFIQIHPFQDGNGRLCRMILNVILCKYAGVVIPIGEHDEDRQEYMAIKQRASAQMEGHGELATFVLKKSISRIRGLKQKLAGKAKKT